MRVCLSRKRLLPAGLVCLAAVLFPGVEPSRGQDKPGPQAETAPADVLPFGPALLLPTDPGVPRKLQALRDYVAAKDWDETARLLQALLDTPEDVFLPVTHRGPDGNEVASVVSLRTEIDRLLTGLPRSGREAYEATVGKSARQALSDAKGQPAALAAVVQRYPHTKAGAEAAVLVAAHHLDRGHFDMAAAYFDRVLRSADGDTPEPVTLFQAAFAFRRAGDRDRAEQAWRRLAADAPDGLRAGDRTLTLADLEKELERSPLAAAKDPPLPAAILAPGPPHEGTAAAWVADAVHRLEGASLPTLPADVPLVVGHKVVARSLRGIRAVDLRTGLPAWEAPSALSLDGLARDPGTHGHVAAWVESYLAGHPSVLLANSLLGTLSTDGRRIYAVEDLPVPARPNNYLAFYNGQGQGLNLADAPGLTDAVYHSRLLALDPDSGKVVWSLGGPGTALPHDSYFLGPPLPLGGKLYVPVQKGFDLRLFCLEPLTGEVAWSQTLATFKSRLVVDGGRRLHAVRLAYGDGLLVCPTHAGGLVAFDLVGRRLAWAHAYREEPPPPEPPPGWGRGMRRPRPRPQFVTEPPNLTSEWKVSAPAVAGGKVVFAATDAPALCCLDLRDGSLVWQTKRGEGDLFLAGVSDGKVLVVGKAEVRALGLKDGKPLWQCATDTPTGRGSIVSGAYHLTVRGTDGKAEELAIDLVRGAVTSRTATPEKAIPEALPLPGGLAPTDIAGLVRQLGSNSCAEREAATNALDAFGAPALDALHRAAASEDPEVRRRAAVLARGIEKRVETAQLFTPQKLRLRYKDTPLAEAVADFARKSGVILRVDIDILRADDRKVTLDTGEVPFWEAFDRFCAAAGLVELPPSLPPPDPRGNSVTVSGMVVGGAGRRTPTDVLRTTPDDRPLELALGDGKFSPRPASRAGALRVSVAPPETPVPNHTRQSGEALFVLDVAAEGRMQWQKAVGLRIDKALDEEGRPLAQLPTLFKQLVAGAGRGSVVINGMPVVPPEEQDGPAARLVAVRLKQPEAMPAKKLKELSGTITAQVRTPREAVVTVENVLKAAGQTVKGRRGSEVKVVEVTTEEDGRVRLKMQVEAAGRSVADQPANPFGGTVIINGKRLGDEDLLSSLNFALVDARGKPFRTVKAMSTGVRTGAAHEYELVYEPEEGQGGAAKFVYADRRTLFVDVPFTFKDLPLP